MSRCPLNLFASAFRLKTIPDELDTNYSRIAYAHSQCTMQCNYLGLKYATYTKPNKKGSDKQLQCHDRPTLPTEVVFVCYNITPKRTVLIVLRTECEKWC